MRFQSVGLLSVDKLGELGHSADVVAMEDSLGCDASGRSESLVNSSGCAGWMFAARIGAGWVGAGVAD
jgi:hypothetical protein